MKTKVLLNNGKTETLTTDDTLTLAFRGIVQSTPITLRARVSDRSLRLLAEATTDPNEKTKLERALEYTLKLTWTPSGQIVAGVYNGTVAVGTHSF